MPKHLATTLINYVAIYLALAGLFVAGDDTDKSAPKLLVISFGGLRPDYLKTHDLSNFEYLKQIGSSSDYMNNSFVTESVPNQWSIVTGLNQESHGMVQNEMYDREMKKKFHIKAEKLSVYRESNEWFGRNLTFEPIWITNQREYKERHSVAEWAGAEYFWNGQAAYWINYEELPSYSELIDQIIDLMTRKSNQVNFGLFYLDILDRTGHKNGPNSNELAQQLELINKKFLGVLIERLKSHKIFEETNLILTSDHGMTNVSEKTAIVLDRYIDTKLFELVIGGPVIVNIIMKNYSNIDMAYESLKKIKNLKLYRRHEIPDKLNFRNNSRSGDLVLVANFGYTIHLNKPSSFLKGAHGYDGALHSSMNSIFIATGPAFKKNYKIAPFKNVDIYPLMCNLLGLKERPNNGSMERVILMLNKELTKNQIHFYMTLSLTPVVLSMIAALILFLTRDRSGPISKGPNSGSVAYRMLTMKDDIDLESESEENETEIFSQI